VVKSNQYFYNRIIFFKNSEKGFGVINFENLEGFENALKWDNTLLNNKKIFVKKFIRKNKKLE
jgi:hypothetical protein